jgi:AAA+ superfamily predicted ATPase
MRVLESSQSCWAGAELSRPAWSEELGRRYLAGEASMFLLHGNTRDLFPFEADGSESFIGLVHFLERFLSRSKDIVLTYNVSQGVRFAAKEMKARCFAAVNGRRALEGLAPIANFPSKPSEVLPMLEALVTDPSQRIAVVIDFFETIVPMSDLSYMSDADKATLVSMQRLGSDPGLLSSDNLMVLVTEHLSDVHRRVVSSAQLATLRIPLPDAQARERFIGSEDKNGVTAEMDDSTLSSITAGLSLIQLQSVFRRARQSGEPILFSTVSARKKEIIERECHGLVEFVEPGHNFSHVGGLEGLKEDLMKVAEAIKKGNAKRVPMGILFVGPMGTGKTYVAEAFAAESGLTCLKFKNFRERWVGSTEGNLEKILDVVEGLGHVLLIIDEADRSMGSDSDGDGGTSSRVIARLKEFMSDTSHRGRVVMMMMTNRPDKLDADLKRPGRFDLKIPFFFPEDMGTRTAILAASARKNGIGIDEAVDWVKVAEATAGYSSAELELVVLAASAAADDSERATVTSADLERATGDVIPSRDTRMLAYMELLAVFESSSRRMLPERYRNMDTATVQDNIDALKAQLGRRAR